MKSQLQARLIVPADVEGDIVVSDEGLSFWGGVDPDTGTVIDAYHPLHGVCLAGMIVLMPTSRGSCSGSSVLLELALKGKAPAALIFREDEEILTLGALIGLKMFERSIGVVRLSETDYARLGREKTARLEGVSLQAGSCSIVLHRISQDDLTLSPSDLSKLNGDHGEPIALAMRMICAIAASRGAERLVDVTRGHIDGCIYSHSANLTFAEAMAAMGATVAIPTTLNAISIERESWPNHGLPRDFGDAACRLADLYVRMGARPTFTCAPYLLDETPEPGENIGWSESNAVIFANTVMGARTAKLPDYLDLFVAMTGRAPETGVYIPDNRRAGVVIDVALPDGHDDALWPLIGWIAGRLSPDRIPLLVGLEHANAGRDDLRAVCSAFGTTSAAPMLHIAGVTPESDLVPAEDARRVRITRVDLAEAWQRFNAGPGEIDLVALGSPHLSLEETRQFARLMANKTKNAGTSVILTLGRNVREAAKAEGIVASLETAGVRLISDLCWCSIVEPIFPPDAKTLMTNSGKYAHYAPGLSGRSVRFGSLADCARAAQCGAAPTGLPDWLQPDGKP